MKTTFRGWKFGLLLALPVSAFAHGGPGACGVGAIQIAQDTLQRTLKLVNAGEAGSYDGLMAEKNLLELKFCNDPYDFDSYLALANNVEQRLAYAVAHYNGGDLPSESVVTVRLEKQGMNQACPTIQAAALTRSNSGNISSAQMESIKQACVVLAK